jgi:2-polyprenyl-6-methoxyphenol hydroxylase-like FAD-dependent oxidoreductase
VLAAGYPTPTVRLGNGAGRVLSELPLGGPQADGTTTTTIRRADLYGALRAEVDRRGIPIRYGRRLADISERADRVAATFTDGSVAEGAVLVGADGLHSRTRKILNPQAAGPRYLGLLNAGGFTTGPIDADVDRTPGALSMAFGRRAFFGWSTAPDGSIWWFANPPSKRPTEQGEWTASRWREHLLELFVDDGIPATAIIRATSEVLGPWNTYDLPRVPVWRSRRTVLLGDAAHAASPSSGQGASMAMEDAVTLGHCLSGRADVPAALGAYEGLRRPRVEKVVAYGRRTSSSKAAGPIGAVLRDAAMPAMLRFVYRNGNPQSWILDHQVPAY